MLYRLPLFAIGLILYATKILSFPDYPITKDFFEKWQGTPKAKIQSVPDEDHSYQAKLIRGEDGNEGEELNERFDNDINEQDDTILDKPFAELRFQGVNICDFWVMYVSDVFVENLGQFIILMLILRAQCDCATEVQTECAQRYDEATCKSVGQCLWEESKGPMLISIITTSIGFLWNLGKSWYWLLVRPLVDFCRFGEYDKTKRRNGRAWRGDICRTAKHNLIAMHKYYYTMDVVKEDRSVEPAHSS